jgi:hypothetical protein
VPGLATSLGRAIIVLNSAANVVGGGR